MKTSLPFFVALGVVAILSSGAQTQTTQRSSSSSTIQNDVLAQDKRLATVITAADDVATGAVPRTRIGRLLGWVDKRTHVRLHAEYENIQDQSVFACFDSVKASALMDGIAALWLTRWEKDTPFSYKMVSGTGGYDAVYLPKDENAREKYAAGVELMDGIAQMPASGVANDLRAGKTVSINDLPRSVQQSLVGVITASDKIIAAMGGKAKFPVNNLAQSTLRIETTPHKDGFSSWFLDIANKDWGSIGTGINDYEQQMKKRVRISNTALYTPVKFAITQESARKLSELRKTVHVNLQNATAIQVLQAVHKQSGVAIIADSPEYLRERKDVRIDADNITEAFDALTQIFPNTEWEYRPSKFFIFRGPGNPAKRKS